VKSGSAAAARMFRRYAEHPSASLTEESLLLRLAQAYDTGTEVSDADYRQQWPPPAWTVYQS